MADKRSRTEDQPAEKVGYREIADALRADIQAGVHAPGAKLPIAADIAKAHGTGKTVVYRAFAELQAEGLVDVRPGSGAFVRGWTPILRDANRRLARQQWGSGHSIWTADLGDRPMGVETTVSLAGDVPDFVREMLDVPRYRVRHRIFTVDRERVQIGVSYLDADVTDGTAIDDVDTGDGGTFARLDGVGLAPTRFREDIRVRKPSDAEAEALKIGTNRQVIEILRENATADGRVVEVTHMVLVADAYVLRYHVTS
jgi:GntR family transcriptional regulator